MRAPWTSAFPAAVFLSIMPAAPGSGETEAVVIGGSPARGAVGATVHETTVRGRLVSLSFSSPFSRAQGMRLAGECCSPLPSLRLKGLDRQQGAFPATEAEHAARRTHSSRTPSGVYSHPFRSHPRSPRQGLLSKGVASHAAQTGCKVFPTLCPPGLAPRPRPRPPLLAGPQGERRQQGAAVARVWLQPLPHARCLRPPGPVPELRPGRRSEHRGLQRRPGRSLNGAGAGKAEGEAASPSGSLARGWTCLAHAARCAGLGVRRRVAPLCLAEMFSRTWRFWGRRPQAPRGRANRAAACAAPRAASRGPGGRRQRDSARAASAAEATPRALLSFLA